MSPLRYPTARIVRSNPYLSNWSRRVSKKGRPDTCAMDFGPSPVTGRRRSPAPPHRMIALVLDIRFFGLGCNAAIRVSFLFLNVYGVKPQVACCSTVKRFVLKIHHTMDDI